MSKKRRTAFDFGGLKRVKCSICGQTVLKAHTLALSDGTRACREHPGVRAESGERLMEEKRIRQERIDAPKKRFQVALKMETEDFRRFQEETAAWSRHVHSHCWVCDAEGVSLQRFFAEALIAMERLELRGEFNFMTFHRDILALMPGIIPLWPVPYDRERDGHIERRIRDQRLRKIIGIIHYLLLCPKCVERFGLAERAQSILPNPSFEDLKNMMPVMGLLKPEIRAIAERKERQS